jgi:hypothetical protein
MNENISIPNHSIQPIEVNPLALRQYAGFERGAKSSCRYLLERQYLPSLKVVSVLVSRCAKLEV